MTNINPVKFGSLTTNPIGKVRKVTPMEYYKANIKPSNIMDGSVEALNVASGFAPAGPLGAIIGGLAGGLHGSYQSYKEDKDDKASIITGALFEGIPAAALGAVKGKQIINGFKYLRNLK